jgi:hypothetical protein
MNTMNNVSPTIAFVEEKMALYRYQILVDP